MNTEDKPELTSRDFRAQRLENLRTLEGMGYTPYGNAFERSGSLSEIRETFSEEKTFTAAGRLITKREMGKSIFAHIQDGTGQFQIYLKKDTVGETAFNAFKVLDLGDHIGLKGSGFITRTGEQTLNVAEWSLLSKSLLPLPDKWDGLQDVEMRYRKRYLDLIANPSSRTVLNTRIAIVREIRAFLHQRGFQEVETPMMQPLAGGAAAEPFKTHYNALDLDMYLRIAPELYLKRLLVGGFDKVFELNRNFRNEGLSRQHNPEFTMLEIYQAYADMETMKDLIQNMICHLAETVMGSLTVGTKEQPIDLTQWRTVPYKTLICETAGEDYFECTLDEQRTRATNLGCEVMEDWDEIEVTQEIFEKCIEKNLIQPTFVTRLPATLVPLAKPCEDDPNLVDVYELIIGGREISPGYNELNNPLIQRERFEAQAQGDHDKLDTDFLEALEYGMPPAGGMGVGIDRLVMLLTGAESIRDVILFPQLKPRG